MGIWSSVALRAHAIKLGHEGHQGVVRTKSYIRSKVWFPNLNTEIESAIQGCIACQANSREPRPREPLKMSEMPLGPWMNLSADFCGPLESGDYLFVIVDEYSRYPIVETIKSVSSNTVIPVLEKILAMFGLPTVIKTDNGSPFNSKAFTDYANYCGFLHRKITPRWPRANAQAEAFNKPLMKCVKSAYVEGKSWKQELYRFLRQYRATPHTITGYTPFRLMFQREPTTRLPEVVKQTGQDKQIDVLARSNDDRSKSHTKCYEDNKLHTRKRNIHVGDKVLLQNESPSKSTTKYKPIPYQVTDVKGPMITAENSKHQVTRNSSYMKKVTSTLKPFREDNVEHDDEIEDQINDQMNFDQKVDSGQNTPIRPVRERRTPAYLGDYVT